MTTTTISVEERERFGGANYYFIIIQVDKKPPLSIRIAEYEFKMLKEMGVEVEV